MRVGFIGLGIMGRPMAGNLLRAGFDLTVYNRSALPLGQLVSLGARSASSPAEVAKSSDVVITMVTDATAVEQVVLGPGGVIEGVHDGLVVVDMSTISPDVTRRVASTLESLGARMLDAPVSGGEQGAKDGTLTIMVGGPERAFESCIPVFRVLGKKVVRMGGNGAGQLAKLANQILVACNMLGVCECLLFAKRAGLDLDLLIDSLSAGAAASWSLTNLGPKAARGDFAPGFKISLLEKDLRYVIAAAREMGIAIPTTEHAHQLYGRLEGDGRGGQGTQALIDAVGT
jgi:3-hydroxyisobutyrate dehydrogenase-like beta-hydroxyacid dehydrogenase